MDLKSPGAAGIAFWTEFAGHDGVEDEDLRIAPWQRWGGGLAQRLPQAAVAEQDGPDAAAHLLAIERLFAEPGSPGADSG